MVTRCRISKRASLITLAESSCCEHNHSTRVFMRSRRLIVLLLIKKYRSAIKNVWIKFNNWRLLSLYCVIFLSSLREHVSYYYWQFLSLLIFSFKFEYIFDCSTDENMYLVKSQPKNKQQKDMEIIFPSISNRIITYLV